jgi:hypothetical protein
MAVWSGRCFTTAPDAQSLRVINRWPALVRFAESKAAGVRAKSKLLSLASRKPSRRATLISWN